MRPLAVRIVQRRFAAEVTTSDRSVSAVLRAAVPASGREWLPESRTWLVFGTRVPALLDALRAAGIAVEITEAPSPGGRE